MKGKRWISTVAVVIPLSLALLAGCSKRPREREYGGITPQRVDPSAMSRGSGTGIESQDLLEVTDKMARGILGAPAIAEAAEPPVIALLPVENNTRFVIQKDLFTQKIRSMLNSKTQGKVRFVARDRMESVDLERQLKQEGALSGKPEGKVLGVDYFLTGRLGGMSQAGSTGQSDYVNYAFQLIDANTTEIVWEDDYDIKKEGMEDVIYR